MEIRFTVDASPMNAELATIAQAVQKTCANIEKSGLDIDKAFTFAKGTQELARLNDEIQAQQTSIKNLNRELLEHRELMSLDAKETAELKAAYEAANKSKGELGASAEKRSYEEAARVVEMEKQAIKDLTLERAKASFQLTELKDRYKAVQSEMANVAGAMDTVLTSAQKLEILKDVFAAANERVAQTEAGIETLTQKSDEFASKAAQLKSEISTMSAAIRLGDTDGDGGIDADTQAQAIEALKTKITEYGTLMAESAATAQVAYQSEEENVKQLEQELEVLKNTMQTAAVAGDSEQVAAINQQMQTLSSSLADARQRMEGLEQQAKVAQETLASVADEQKKMADGLERGGSFFGNIADAAKLVKETVSSSFREMTQPVTDFADKAKQRLSQFSNDVSDTFSNLSQKIGLDRLSDGLTEYKDKIIDTATGNGKFQESIKGVGTAVGNLAGPFKSSIAGAVQMTKALWAMAATPIGAVLTAIVASLQAVNTWFHRSAEGQKAFAQISAYLGSLFESIGDIVSIVGKYLFHAFADAGAPLNAFTKSLKTTFVNAVKSVGELLGGLGNTIKGIFTLDWDTFSKGMSQMWNGVKDAGKTALSAIETQIQLTTGTVKLLYNAVTDDKLGKEIGQAFDGMLGKADKARRLASQQIDLDIKAQEAQKERLRIENEIAANREKIYTVTGKEREALIEETKELEKQKFDQQLATQKEQLEIIRQKNNLHDSTLEDLAKERELEISVLRTEMERTASTRRLVTMQESNRRQMEASTARQAAAAKNDTSRQNALTQADAKLQEVIYANTDARIKAELEMEERITEARIAAMREGAEKVEAEREQEQRKALLQIENQRKAAVEAETKRQKAEFDAQQALIKADGGKVTAWSDRMIDTTAINRINEQYKQISLLNTQKFNNAQLKQQAQFMRDYLKEYGTYQQQKLAIAEEYAEKIAEAQKAENQGEMLRLQAEQQKKNAQIEIAAVKESIDWNIAFGELGNILKEQIEPTIERLEKVTQSDDFKALGTEEKREVYDLIKNLRTQQEEWGKVSLTEIGVLVNEYQKIIARKNEAEEEEIRLKEEYNKAVENNIKVQNDPNATESQKKVAQEAVDNAKKAWDASSVNVQDLGKEASTASAKLKSASDRMRSDIERLGNALSGLTSGSLKGVYEAFSELDKMFNGGKLTEKLQKSVGDIFNKLTRDDNINFINDKVSEKITGLLDGLDESKKKEITKTISDNVAGLLDGEKADDVKKKVAESLQGLIADPKAKENVEKAANDVVDKISEGLGNGGGIIGAIISLILGVLDTLKDVGLGGVVAGLIDLILGAVDGIIKNIISGDFAVQIVGAIVKGIGNLLNTITFGGFDSWFGFNNDNHEKELEYQEKLNKSIEATTKALKRMTEQLYKSYGMLALQTQEEAENLLRQNLDTQVKGLNSALNDNYGGGHSDFWHWNEAQDILRQMEAFAQRQGISLYEQSQGKYTMQELLRNDSSAIAAMFKDISEHDTELWRQLTQEIGYSEGAVGDWMEKLIDTYEQFDEVAERTKEQLTTTTADNVFDDFLNSLYDLADGAEDVTDSIADNWQKMVNRMIINNLIIEDFREDLKRWYEDLASLNQELADGLIDTDTYNERLEGMSNRYNQLFDDARGKIEDFKEKGFIKPIEEATDEAKEYFNDLRDSWLSTLTDMTQDGESWKKQLMDTIFSDLVESTILNAPLDVMIGDAEKHYEDFQAYIDDWTARYKMVIESQTLTDEERNEQIRALLEEQTNIREQQAEKSRQIADGIGYEIKEEFTNSLNSLGDTMLDALLDTETDAAKMGAEIGKTLVEEMLKEILATEKYAKPMEQIRQMWQNVLKGGGSWTDEEGLFGEEGLTYTLDVVLAKISALNDEIANDEDIQKATRTWQDFDKSLQQSTSSFGDLRNTFMDAIMDMENGTENFGKKIRETLVKDLIEKKVFEGFDEYQKGWTERYLDALESGDETLLDALTNELEEREKAMAKSVEEYVRRLQETAKDTTFTDMEGDFVSTLMDMEGDIGDFANNMKKTIVQRLVESFMVSEKIKPLLDDLQKTFDTVIGMESLSIEERARMLSEGFEIDGERFRGINDITDPEGMKAWQDTVTAALNAAGYEASKTATAFDDLADRIANALTGSGTDAEDFVKGLTDTIISEFTAAYMATDEFKERLNEVKDGLAAAAESGDTQAIKAAEDAARALFSEVEEGTRAIRELGMESDTTFSDMADSFVSSLMDMNKSAEDWAESIGQTMAQRIIQQMVVPAMIQPLLDNLQGVFNSVVSSATFTGEDGSTSYDWQSVINNSALTDAINGIKAQYPGLQAAITQIMSALGLGSLPENPFKDMVGTFVSALTDMEKSADDFAKDISLMLTEQMIEKTVTDGFQQQIEDIGRKWQQALETGDETAIERITEQLKDLEGEMAEAVKPLLDSIKDINRQTDTTFSSMTDSWVNALMDMEGTAEEFAENVGRTMAQKIITQMVAPIYIQPILDRLQESFDEAIAVEGATISSVIKTLSPFMDEIEDVYNQITPIRDEIFHGFNIYSDTVEEAVEEVQYALNDMKSNFTSALMDMSNTAEDFSSDISKIMAQNFIENFVLGKKFDQQMEYWQGQYERIIGGGYSEDERKKQLRQLRDTIAAAKEGYVEEARAIQELLGVGTTAEDKKASVSMADKITYDQADEMTGILRAIQIAGEQRNDIQRQILDTLQTNSLIPTFSSSALNDNNMMLSETLLNLAQNMSAIQGAVSEMRVTVSSYGDYLFGIDRAQKVVRNLLPDISNGIDDVKRAIEGI